MKYNFILILFLAAFQSCGNDRSFESGQINKFDGSYCAEVTYKNPNTGKQSQYTLIVEVDANNLERINFPQGWLDEDNFDPEVLNADGFASIKSDRGYIYEVQVIGEATGCFDNVAKPKRCSGTIKDGTRCSRLTDNISGYCWQHEVQK